MKRLRGPGGGGVHLRIVVQVKVFGLLVMLVVPGVARAQPAPGALRLEDAIHLALAHNERAAIADLDITSADAGVAKARAAFLPILALSGNTTLRPRSSPVDVTSGTLSLNQPLLVPSAFSLYSQAKHSLAAQRAQSADDKRQLAFDAAKAFFNVLLADAVEKAAQRKLDTAKADMNDTEAQVRAQLVSTNDVTRAKISLSSSTRELSNDQGNLAIAYLQLETLLATKIAPGSLEIPDTVLAAGQKPVPVATDLVARSLARRPDLAARKDVALAAHDFAREPRMRWFPSFGLNGQLNATTNPGASGHDIDGSVAVTASWTIFDAGSRSADAQSRDANAAVADLETAALVRAIDSEVRSSAVSLSSAQQALGAARDAMEASRKSADETAILYRQGLAKAIELLDANEQRFAAEVAFAEAEFAVANAYLALRQAVGLDPLGEELR